MSVELSRVATAATYIGDCIGEPEENQVHWAVYWSADCAVHCALSAFLLSRLGLKWIQMLFFRVGGKQTPGVSGSVSR